MYRNYYERIYNDLRDRPSRLLPSLFGTAGFCGNKKAYLKLKF
jgi:hypothetical protein